MELFDNKINQIISQIDEKCFITSDDHFYHKYILDFQPERLIAMKEFGYNDEMSPINNRIKMLQKLQYQFSDSEQVVFHGHTYKRHYGYVSGINMVNVCRDANGWLPKRIGNLLW